MSETYSESVDTKPQNFPRIAMMMEDDYAWDQVRDSQLPELDFEVWEDCLSWSEAELTQRLRGVDAVVTGRKSPCLPDALIQDTGRLRALFHCHGGIRGRAKKEHLLAGIVVTNWGKQGGGSVAEGALTLILACLKQLRNAQAWVENGKQVETRIDMDYSHSLFRQKVGLYGFGPIGSQMAELLAPFSPDLAIYDPYAEHVPSTIKRCESLEALFDHSNVISIHCGLNVHTENSVTADLLDRLPQGGVLVNTARGKIVDEAALAERVHAGQLLAGLDVVREEGAGWATGPMIGTTNAILTGHRISGGKRRPASKKGPRLLAGYVVKNIKALLADESLDNIITPEEYDLKT